MAIYSKTYIVGNSDPEGLHARPGVKFISLAKNYLREMNLYFIGLVCGEKRCVINKEASLIQIMNLEAKPKKELRVDLFYDNCGEEIIKEASQGLGKIIQDPANARKIVSEMETRLARISKIGNS